MSDLPSNFDFAQVAWDRAAEEDCRELVRLAIREELEHEQDWTTLGLTPGDRVGAACITPREAGIVAGMPAVQVALEVLEAQVECTPLVAEGSPCQPGAPIGRLSGKVRDMLTAERIVLNLLGRLMGVATRTRDHVRAVEGCHARIYDTRKTTPGWRRLEKYAVRCGGGRNHRTGLYDAVLIKDNHLAQLASPGSDAGSVAVEALRRVRELLAHPIVPSHQPRRIVEIEVDDLAQLAAVLPHEPDIVLLDNMDAATLRQAVALRDQLAPRVQLEASGGVALDRLREIAQTGVERISIGSLTHGARWLDVGLDWEPAA
jgi:nicotinate-nucleotide pyrophosphorylase (carboxylating)